MSQTGPRRSHGVLVICVWMEPSRMFWVPLGHRAHAHDRLDTLLIPRLRRAICSFLMTVKLLDTVLGLGIIHRHTGKYRVIGPPVCSHLLTTTHLGRDTNQRRPYARSTVHQTTGDLCNWPQ